jgi:SAM-dependent methyltransferase
MAASRVPCVRLLAGNAEGTIFAAQLSAVNVIAPTVICRTMTRHGSDKARLNRYTPLYAALFLTRRALPLRILELGLGSNNLDVPSNMGVFGAPGASLRAWRDIFPRATVVGADIDRRILFQENRISTFYCDQLDPNSIRALWSQPVLRDGADIIIEDGLHTLAGNISFLEASLDHLRPGGVYVVEDIDRGDAKEWARLIEGRYAPLFPAHAFAYVTLPGKGAADLLFIKRAEGGPRAAGRRA